MVFLPLLSRRNTTLTQEKSSSSRDASFFFLLLFVCVLVRCVHASRAVPVRLLALFSRLTLKGDYSNCYR